MTKYLEMILCSKIQFSILVNIGLVSTCLSLPILQSNWSTEIKQSLTHGQYCYLNSDCQINELCVDLKCQCSPIYKFFKFKCVLFRCIQDTDCQSYDPNQRCLEGTFGCKVGYEAEIYGLRCGKWCFSNTNCQYSEVCFSGTCVCKQGYIRKNGSKCVFHACHKNSYCWYNFHDYNSWCSSGSCVCNSHYFMD